jgi:hypothetical protein
MRLRSRPAGPGRVLRGISTIPRHVCSPEAAISASRFSLSILPFLRPPVFGSPLGLPRAANFKPFPNLKLCVHDMYSPRYVLSWDDVNDLLGAGAKSSLPNRTQNQGSPLV